MTTLVTIGHFADLTRLSIRMLRHYDERGLLRPAHIDPSTGYRYYRLDQAPTAEVIRLLRAFDVPLDKIARILDSLGTDELPQLLAEHADRIAARLEEQRRSLAYLKELISYVEQERDFELGDIAIEEFKPQPILSRREPRTLDDVGVFTGETIGLLFDCLETTATRPAGAPFAIYHQRPELDGFDVEVGVPLQLPAVRQESFIARELPGGKHAVLTHVGPYESLGAAYRALGSWLAREDLQPSGPPREIYLTSPRPDLSPADYRTCLAWPIQPTESE